MDTEHDSMLFQPEDDGGWSCGPFTILKVLETLLQLERIGKTKFLGNRGGTIPFGDGVLESFKTSGGSN